MTSAPESTAPSNLGPAPARGATPSKPMKGTSESFGAIVVGSGPNGLAAAITLAEAGWRVLVLEARPTIGGGMRTDELTLPGYRHDVCSAIHPMAVASPFFRSQSLIRYGLEWCYPDVQVAHPLDDGTAVALYRSVERTAAQFGPDAPRYQRVFGKWVRGADALLDDVLGPLALPRSPFLTARFGLQALRTAERFARSHFRGVGARALFGGNAAHSVLPFNVRLSAAAGMMLMISAHAYGWPVAKGGSQAIADALAARFRSLGGVIQTDCKVQSLAELPKAKVVLFDSSPRSLADIAQSALPEDFRSKLHRYRHGPAAFKVDYALSGPIPWTAPECRSAGTVHVGGTFEEIAAAELSPWNGYNHPRPFVLVGQQSVVDPTRAPATCHTGWAYCHVPNGSERDVTDALEAQIERFAPGFQARVLARRVTRPLEFAMYNANYVGGDIVGGVQDLGQLFTRPTARMNPYTTPNKRLFFCSASTPPGAGVHGMCGFHAARAVLRRAASLEPSRF